MVESAGGKHFLQDQINRAWTTVGVYATLDTE